MSGQGPQFQDRSTSFLASITQSPILWGGALTVGFYASIPHLPRYRELAERYFCSHPLEYATSYLFFVGVAVLIVKALSLNKERAALSIDLFEGLDQSGVSLAEGLTAHIKQVPSRYQETWYLSRMRDVANYLTQRQSHTSLEEHLRYLAERASEKLHSSYALVRTVTWAVPILGFLGTVIGITIAIANISLADLQNSLTDVVGGLSVAFDTTALALTLSLLLVFGSFLVERMENQILSDVEDAGVEQIGFRLRDEPIPSGSPLMQAEHQAGEELLAQTREMISWQSRLWRESLDEMRERWVEGLRTQEAELAQAIGGSVKSSLAHHEETVDKAREDFLVAFDQIACSIAENNQRSESLNRSIQTELAEQTRNSQEELASFTRELAQSLVGELKAWQKHLHSEEESSALQLREVRRQTEMLTKLLEQDAALSSLTERLNGNLAAVTAGNKLEEVLHNLNAAIHLLTARSLPRAA